MAGKPDGAGFGMAFELDEPEAVRPKKPAAPAAPPQGAPAPTPAPGAPPPAKAPAAKPAAGAQRSPFERAPAGQTPKEAAESTGLPNHYTGDRIDLGIPAHDDDQAGPPINLRDAAMDAARIAAEKGKLVAGMTREAASVVADRTRSVAIHAAVMSIGGAAPEKVIRLEDPSTWLKPMRGPLIALGLAVLLSFVGVIVGRVTGSPLPIGWISGLLLLGAIVFAVVRWLRLQQE